MLSGSNKRRRSRRLQGNPLAGIAAVQHAFDYLPGPAHVLSASAVSRRWRVLATADVVWRGKFEREKMRVKAGLFEIVVPSSEWSDSTTTRADSSTTATAETAESDDSEAESAADSESAAQEPPSDTAIAIATAEATVAGAGRVTLAVYKAIYLLKVRPSSVSRLTALANTRLLAVGLSPLTARPSPLAL